MFEFTYKILCRYIRQSAKRLIARSSILGKRHHQIRVENLSSLLLYILSHRPDEFGLVPDGRGFVTYKELLQVVHEETGWHHVRRSHINEVLLGKDRHLFESEENRIRSLKKHWKLDLENPTPDPPKLLFTPVRRKAHPIVMEKGLTSSQGRHIVLSPDQVMARRIGTRRDPKPVVLEIMSAAAQRKGVLFYPFGTLFLSFRIPAEFISGPPVSKEVLTSLAEAEARKEKVSPRQLDITAGTFFLDAQRDPDPYRRAKGKKRKGWKEEARKLRRGKRR